MENIFKRYWWIGVIVAIVIIALIYRRMNDSKSYVPNVVGSEHINECEQLVMEQLKSPATAKFSDVIYTNGTPVGQSITILGDVDSQNSFSAMIRSHFGCEKKIGEDMTAIVY